MEGDQPKGLEWWGLNWETTPEHHTRTEQFKWDIWKTTCKNSRGGSQASMHFVYCINKRECLGGGKERSDGTDNDQASKHGKGKIYLVKEC